MVITSRTQLVDQVRKLQGRVESLVTVGRKIHIAWINAIYQIPPEVLFHHEATRGKLISTIDSLQADMQFLSAAKIGERRSIDFHLLDRPGFAAKIINSVQIHDNENNPQNVEQSAIVVLERQLTKAAQQLSQLKKSRTKLQSLSRELLSHLQDAVRLGLIDSEHNSICNIKSMVQFLLTDRYVVGHKVKEQQAFLKKFTKLKGGENYRKRITHWLQNYMNEILCNKERVLARRKQQIFTDGVRNRLASLEKQCTSMSRVPELCLAITGLYFAYLCLQGLELGQLAVEQHKMYEASVHSASRSQLASAIQQIFVLEILSKDQFQVFRYHEQIREAYLDVIGIY